RHRDELVQQVAASRLAVLEQLVLARLAQGVAASAEQAAVRHALQMKHAADENRRAFRKFLKAHLGGQQDYVVQHPRVDLARWLQGMPFAGATEAGGPVRIGVEQDPLEALKLGTYVGSCVGLGGAFSYSAVAVVLDVNKQ